MLFLSTEINMETIQRKDYKVFVKTPVSDEPLTFKVTPGPGSQVTLIGGKEELHVNVDIFVLLVNGEVVAYSPEPSNPQVDIENEIKQNKFYMIPLIKEDSAVRSTFNKKRLEKYKDILDPFNLIFIPEDVDVREDLDTDDDEKDIISMELFKVEDMSDNGLKTTISKSPFPTYIQLSTRTLADGTIQYLKRTTARLPEIGKTYIPIIYDPDTKRTELASQRFYLTKLSEKESSKDIMDGIEEDFFDDPEAVTAERDEEPTAPDVYIPMPKYTDRTIPDWTQNVNLHVNINAAKLRPVYTKSCVKFTPALPEDTDYTVFCSSIIPDIRKAESYAAVLNNVMRFEVEYNFRDRSYMFDFYDHNGSVIRYNFFPVKDSQVYIAIFDGVIIIDSYPYRDSKSNPIPYVKLSDIMED